MKRIGIITGIICLTAISVLGKPWQSNPGDTIIIEFGNNSRIMFIIQDRQDLETIKNYDLNAILEDLSLKIENAGNDNSILKIEDETGTKYLKDTTIIVEDIPSDLEKDDNNFERDRDFEREFDEDKDDNYQDENDRDRRDSRQRFGRRTRQNFNIELGTNNYLENGKFPDENNKPYSVRPWGSWYLGLNTTYKTTVGGPLFIEWGGGLDWYNFKFEDDQTRIIKTDTLLLFQPDTTTGVYGRKSKFTVSYIYLKFVPLLDFSFNRGRSRLWNRHGDGFRIGAGGYAAFRISSHSKFVFKQNGDRERDKDRNNLFLNNLRYGLRFQIGFRGLDMFVNYDMSELFSDGKGPALNAFTFGFTL